METIFMNRENSKTNEPVNRFQITMLLFKTYLFITRGRI